MKTLQQLFENNRRWADQVRRINPDFFENLSTAQHPNYLWIGCSDSRVPANEIIGTSAGEVFVHRNVANLIPHSDLNSLSVLQYGVEALKVEHVIVCGHYGCGGVRAAMDGVELGLIDNWLLHLDDLYIKHREELDAIEDLDKRHARFCELNVMEQVHNVCMTNIVQAAWDKGQTLSVHGWIYALTDGLLQDLDVCITGLADLKEKWPAGPRARVRTET